jgi:hypothetical protein
LQWSEEERKKQYAIAKQNWSLWSRLQLENNQFPALPPWPPACHTWERKNIHGAQPLPTMTDVDLTGPVPDAVAVLVPDAVSSSTLSGSKRKTPPAPLFSPNKNKVKPVAGLLASRFGVGKSSPESLSVTASTSTSTTAVSAAAAAVTRPREFINRPTVRTLHLPTSLVDKYEKEKKDEWCVSRCDDPPIAYWLRDTEYQIVFDL